MNQNLQPGMHPDADQLSTFVEGAANARERESMLVHLAECAECRDVVFLMQGPVTTREVPAVVTKKSIWPRWFLPVGLAGAALACGLTAVLVFNRPHSSGPESVQQSAALHQPESHGAEEPVAPTSKAAPSERPNQQQDGSNRDAARMNAGPQAKSLKPPPTAENLPMAVTVPSQQAAPPPPVPSFGAVAGEAAAPTGAAEVPNITNQAMADMPLNGRNVTNMQSTAAPSSVKAATPQADAVKQQGLSALKFERAAGLADTLSGVSGRVTDASGATIPNASVALRNAVGSTQQTTTGVDGSFQLSGLPAGHFELTISAPGFKSSQQPIDLKPSELAMLQPVLNVGAVTETVAVTSSAPMLQTESASVGQIAAELPSRLPVASTVSLGKRLLSLDNAGNLFLSRNAGKSWKKIKPQWTGKAVRIELPTAETSDALRKSAASRQEGAQTAFQLTTDSGIIWTSKDGTRWRQQ